MATRISSVLLATMTLALSASVAGAQTPPTSFPVPFTTAVAGLGSAAPSTCGANLLAADGTNYGDGCTGTLARLSSPQGAAVDKFGNVYVADYSDRLVRVLYKGGTAVAAAITAANSGYAISSSRNASAVMPVAGNIYTIAGVGENFTIAAASSSAGTVGGFTVTASDGKFECANYAATGQPEALDSLGDGCPAAASSIGARDVAIDNDGNLILTDYTNNRIRILCVNCTGTLAATLIKTENPGVTPMNGSIYTVAGYSLGYRDQYLGFGNPSTPEASVTMFRSPTAAVVSSSEDIFIADNTNNAVRVLYNGGTAAANILHAEGYTPIVGYVYTIAGADCVGAATSKLGYTSSNECLATTGSDTATLGTVPGANATAATATTGAAAISTAWTVYLDANSNVYYTDAGNARIKVIYAGIGAPLTLPNTTYPTLHAGYVYSFAGQGTQATTSGIAPSAVKLTSAQGVGGDANGNIFFIDYSTGAFYETYAQNGLTAVIGGVSGITTPTAGAYCNGGNTGPTMTDAFYNGCPLTQATLSNPRGPLVADANGNLYFGDSVGYFLREFSFGNVFPATAAGVTSATQPLAFTSAALVGTAAVTEGGATGADFTDVGGDTCPTTTNGATCVVNVTFKPSSPGVHTGAASSVLAGVTQDFELLRGTGTGPALNIDPATATTTGTTLTPEAIAVDGAGRVYVADGATHSVLRYTGSTATTVATGLTAPTGIAVDGVGNVFVADSSANTITEVPALAPGTPFTLATGLSSPHGLATDSAGNLYVADTGNNRIDVYAAGKAPGSSTIAAFTGLSAPKDVATDLNGSIYVIDTSHVVKLTTAGTQTTVATTGGTALAVDAAGNVLATTGATLVEYPAGGGSSITLPSTLTTPVGIALDGSGDAFIADSGLKGYYELQRTAGYYKFLNNPDNTTVYLTSAGTAALSSTAFTQSDSVDYALAAATTNGCSGALAAGSNCALAASYAGTNPCVVPDSVVFTAPVGNGAPGLTLTSASVVPCISVTALPASITYGMTETLTANVTGPSNTSGTVIFYTGSTQLASKAVDNTASASYSYIPAVSTSPITITATFTPTGSASPTLTSAPASFTVKQATPTVTLVPSATVGYTTTSFIFTATVAATYGAPGGSVYFYSGSTMVGSGSLNGNTAMATVTNLPIGMDCIKATYQGDPNFTMATNSACVNVNVAAGFGVTSSSTALSFSSYTYQEAQALLTIQPGGRTDTLSFSCNGLPAKLSCVFTPATLALSGLSGPQSVQMLLSNSGAHAALEPAPHLNKVERNIALAAVPLASLLLFGLRRRRRLPAILLLMALTLAGSVTLTGCGNSPLSVNQGSGTYNFTVVVNNGSSTLQTLNFTITVPQQ